jgi:isopenicillin-N epimerase
VNHHRPTPLTAAGGAPGRTHFRLDPGRHHLNHGSYGAVPSRTIDHRAALTQQLESNPFRWFEELQLRHATMRAAIAPFVGAMSNEIAMVTNASAAASSVYASIPLRPGDEVLLTDHVYGAVAMGAARYARSWGATVRIARVPLDADAAESCNVILEAVTGRTRLVVVDHISSATARRFPVDELVAALAERDVTVVIDGAHAMGILPQAAVRAPHVVWFGNLHKYACAPRGAAVIVAQGALAQRLVPIIDSWGADLAYPDRFDLQGSSDSTGFLSAAHAIATLDDLFGWDRIRHYSAELSTWAAEAIANELAPLMHTTPLPEVGMPVPQHRLLQLPAGVAADAASARTLKDRLAAEAQCEVGVSSWEGTGFIRISAHVYNEASDYEHFIEHAIPIIATVASSKTPALSTLPVAKPLQATN